LRSAARPGGRSRAARTQIRCRRRSAAGAAVTLALTAGLAVLADGGGGAGFTAVVDRGGPGSSRYLPRLIAPSVLRGTTADGNGLITISW